MNEGPIHIKNGLSFAAPLTTLEEVREAAAQTVAISIRKGWDNKLSPIMDAIRAIPIAEAKSITDEQIKHMTNRFLMWRLPANFNPDAGISFRPEFNEHTAHPMKHEPTGTNLFDYNQAEAMVRYMIEGMP